MKSRSPNKVCTVAQNNNQIVKLRDKPVVIESVHSGSKTRARYCSIGKKVLKLWLYKLQSTKSNLGEHTKAESLTFLGRVT